MADLFIHTDSPRGLEPLLGTAESFNSSFDQFSPGGHVRRTSEQIFYHQLYIQAITFRHTDLPCKYSDFIQRSTENDDGLETGTVHNSPLGHCMTCMKYLYLIFENYCIWYVQNCWVEMKQKIDIIEHVTF